MASVDERVGARQIRERRAVPNSSAGAVVRAHLEAFSSGDLPTMLATMAPNAVFMTGSTLLNPQEFEDFFGWAMREIDPTMQITNSVESRMPLSRPIGPTTWDGPSARCRGPRAV